MKVNSRITKISLSVYAFIAASVFLAGTSSAWTVPTTGPTRHRADEMTFSDYLYIQGPAETFIRRRSLRLYDKLSPKLERMIDGRMRDQKLAGKMAIESEIMLRQRYYQRVNRGFKQREGRK